MQIISMESFKSISGGAPENPPPPPQTTVAITGGGNENFAYGQVAVTIPVTPNVDVQSYANGNTVTGVNQFGGNVIYKF